MSIQKMTLVTFRITIFQNSGKVKGALLDQESNSALYVRAYNKYKDLFRYQLVVMIGNECSFNA